MALTYLLRGVDVPTISLLILLATVGCLCTTSIAVALGAASVSARFRALPTLLAFLSLGTLTIALASGMYWIHRAVERAVRLGEVGEILLGMSLPVLLTLALAAMIASAFLSHPYENRSTRFRVLGLVGVLGTFLWAGLNIPHRHSSEVGPVMAATLGVFVFPILLFAVTEPAALSPRVRTLVPRRPLLALLSLPFLPGGGRGMLYTILLAVTTLGGAALYSALLYGTTPDRTR
ncbi:MAG: hypothetical protein HC813_03140 [Planctomycetes bacterium]|nr:hypothetical protein [Planctomycetota bacterium]